VTEHDRQPYGLILLRPPAFTRTATLRFDDPTDCLAAAVEYLRRGYQCRLSDATTRALTFTALPACHRHG
jgi:hypothetical protein